MPENLEDLKAEVARLGALVDELMLSRHTVVEVEQLRVVEPDGTLRLLLSSRGSFPQEVQIGGQHLYNPRAMAGILLFNDDGDECGGLAVSGTGDGSSGDQEGALSFDRYAGDQTVQVVQEDSGGKRSAGLRVVDQPDVPLSELASRWEPLVGPDKRDRQAAIDALGQEGLLPAERVFVGRTEDGTAIIRLSDAAGVARVVLQVGADGAVSVEGLQRPDEAPDRP